jgi:predicted secreted protein
MPRTKAAIGFGTLLKRGDGATPTEVFSTVSEVLDITGGVSKTRSFEDATNMESPGGVREYIAALIDLGEITFQMNAVFTDAQQQAVHADLMSGVLRNWQLVLPSAIGKRWEGAAFVASIGNPHPVAGKMVRDVTLRPSGDWTFVNNP